MKNYSRLWIFIALHTILLVPCAALAQIQTEFAIACDRPNHPNGALPMVDCAGYEKYRRPRATDLVRACAPGAPGTQVTVTLGQSAPAGSCWWGPTYSHRQFGTLPEDTWMEVCADTTIAEHSVLQPNGAPCKRWKLTQKRNVIKANSVAGEIEITFDPPTQYVDNTPLNSADIQHYKLEHADTVDAAYSVIDYLTDDKTLSGVAGGTHCYRLYTIMKTGEESAPSSSVCTSVDAPARPKPNAPGGVRIRVLRVVPQ